MEELDAVVAGDGKGGVGCPGVGAVLCCGFTRGPYVWVGDVDHFPTHWEDSGRTPPQGGFQVDGLVSK